MWLESKALDAPDTKGIFVKHFAPKRHQYMSCVLGGRFVSKSNKKMTMIGFHNGIAKLPNITRITVSRFDGFRYSPAVCKKRELSRFDDLSKFEIAVGSVSRFVKYVERTPNGEAYEAGMTGSTIFNLEDNIVSPFLSSATVEIQNHWTKRFDIQHRSVGLFKLLLCDAIASLHCGGSFASIFDRYQSRIQGTLHIPNAETGREERKQGYDSASEGTIGGALLCAQILLGACLLLGGFYLFVDAFERSAAISTNAGTLRVLLGCIAIGCGGLLTAFGLVSI